MTLAKTCLVVSLAGLATAAGGRAVGADVVILVTPKCVLDPQSVDLSNRHGTFPYHTLNHSKAATFAEGASVKDVNVTGETFVVELLATVVKPGTRTATLTPVGARGAVPITYKVAALKQPYKVWYVKGPGAAPVLMAEWAATGEGSELEYETAERVVVHKFTPAEVARREMRTLHDSRLANDLHDAFADKIIAGKPQFLTSSERLGTRPPLPGEQPSPHPLFRPKKIAYGPKGDASVEVELHNRLPVRATGVVARTKTFAQGRIESAVLKAGGKPRLTDTAKFDLEPGEKKTLTITVPAEYVTEAKLTSQSMIHLVRLELTPRGKR